MSSPAPDHPNSRIYAASSAVAVFLDEEIYAIVGGAALAILVVRTGRTTYARNILREQKAYFEVEKRTLYTHYMSNPPIEIEILTPPMLFPCEFDESTTTMVVDGIRILHPVLILNSKCRAILGRATDDKKRTDAQDIQFLLSWLKTNAVQFSWNTVPNASREFVQWYVSVYNGREYWTNAGYEL
ncbi:hypothetical protein V2W45_1466001 [Cenococcum geophilum]